MSYRRLTSNDRYQIADLKRSGISKSGIAKNMGLHRSTISRELSRNADLGSYKPVIAHAKAKARRASVHRPLKITGNVKKQVLKLLSLQWSPEQISGHLRKHNRLKLSPETIYRFVYRDFKAGGELYRNLRRHRKRRRSWKAGRGYKRCGKRSSYPPIGTRPAIVESRKRLGDYERDTVLGKFNGPVLLCIVDRKSRFTRIAKVQKIDAKLTHKATVRLLAGQRVRTITNDNGPEFADYKHTAKRLNTSVYFSDPYCSWQRGTNENTNGLIRQYFPKGTDFSKVSNYKIKKVENLLNTRPRKTLCFRTPSEVVKRKKSGVALRS